MKKKRSLPFLTDLPITGYAAEGKSIAHIDGKVVFVTGAIPGDRADVQLVKNKKEWAEGLAIRITAPSPDRVEPFCKHFGTCGGCKWQHLPYAKQLEFKQQEVFENIKRIAKTEPRNWMPIVGAPNQQQYRNKLEFTASTKNYIPREQLNQPEQIVYQPALGYHAPRIFDKVIDIETCYLMDPINNKIRNTIRDFMRDTDGAYYDIKEHTGWLRNVIIRYTSTGELMVNVCFGEERTEAREQLFTLLLNVAPEISTLLYTINPKHNDTIYDLTPQVYFGNGVIVEQLGSLKFIISPKSFFQTNTQQAVTLYKVVKDFAGLTGKEIVYDLYCGTGRIGLFVAEGAKKLIGVEVIDQAIHDAKRNAEENGIHHAQFFCGDVIKVCDDQFFSDHGHPDVVITDPPRAGMHEKLIRKLLDMEAPRIVYVSCNAATMARDIGLLLEKYELISAQPVDMFPHTHHIECVSLLEKRKN